MNGREAAPPARILHVDDQPETHEWLKLALERKQFQVTAVTSGQAALASFTSHRPDVVLLDHQLPDQNGLEVLRQFKNADPLVEVVMLTGHGSVSLAVEAMREGAFGFVEKPVEFAVLDAVLDKALAHRALHAEATRLRLNAERREGFTRLVGTSPTMKRLFDLIQLVAPTDASVLIRGENGTGKELVADAVHERSSRSRGPIVKINCGAIPGDLFESELFGHKRGAFTGALADKRGLIESADHGTLLLDEIGEMPANAQVKLLRVLQEKQVRRLGDTHMSAPDFRLICATNARLETLMADNRVREDLYFRINTVVLDIPPLRERREDIPVLAQVFLQRYAEKYERDVVRYHPSVLQRLMKHVWRGNVRELEHVVEHAVIVATGRDVQLRHLPESFRSESTVDDTSPLCTLEDVERAAIVRTLAYTRGNKRAAADILGVYRPTLYAKMRKYGLMAAQEEPTPA
ncbi:MAG: sigma-54-dependent Fis family transcriptional regulator [Acidobacteria bacterium]|nr:sigma-54-dependent Fis family transcriptional regulator [Acidobacteriota bacterium]